MSLLTKKQIEEIAKLQLRRVRRMANGQGINLEFELVLIDHLAEVGYRSGFGARELRRMEVKNHLAEASLRTALPAGATSTRASTRRKSYVQKGQVLGVYAIKSLKRGGKRPAFLAAVSYSQKVLP